MGRIADNISDIRRELPPNVKLVAVSKFRPVEELLQAYDAGQRVFAESRSLEFESKVKELPSDIEWHFIGHLQTNKLRKVLPYVHLVHSVDSLHLLEAIQDFSKSNNIVTNVLLEIHIGAEETKQGFLPEEVLELLPSLSEYDSVRVRGLMGMASHTNDSGRIAADFDLIRNLHNEVLKSNPSMTELSIGMSEDWRIAVTRGATMVRIGSSIFLR